MCTTEIILQGRSNETRGAVNTLRQFAHITPDIQLEVWGEDSCHMILRGYRAPAFKAIGALCEKLSRVPAVHLSIHGPYGEDDDDLTRAEVEHMEALFNGTSSL